GPLSDYSPRFIGLCFPLVFVSVSLTGEASEIPCEFCTKTFPEEQLLQHQVREHVWSSPADDGKALLLPAPRPAVLRPSSSRSHPYTAHFPHPQLPPRLPAPLLSSPSGSDSGSEDFDEISSCSVCACALPSEILQQHEEKCRFYDWQRKMGMKQNPMNDNKNL
ncbi:XIAP-associated factor 1-like, partial [Heptranchias perlo]|uniref:XIAP-associated factor 1-like n=1 Tax=Heptranchias perlo TaxID=212740 RepID=UPI00355A612E